MGSRLLSMVVNVNRLLLGGRLPELAEGPVCCGLA
jgi:hypothetical protein